MNDRLKEAYEFVKEKHKDQKRKFTGEPYLTHLEGTANLLYTANEDAETDDFIAALLHDVVEDTLTTSIEVGQHFGKVVMDLVIELTSDEKYTESKEIYLTNKINKMSKMAFTIKLCDRLDNITGLSKKVVPSGFRIRYIDETKYIINNIDREINSVQKYLIGAIKSMLLYTELSVKV